MKFYDDNNLMPIETMYEGTKFWSRLEVRWAFFFDLLGIKWKYEPEQFDMGGRTLYTPDFEINGMYIEIKPPSRVVKNFDIDRMSIFTQAHDLTVFYGDPMGVFCNPYTKVEKLSVFSEFCGSSGKLSNDIGMALLSINMISRDKALATLAARERFTKSSRADLAENKSKFTQAKRENVVPAMEIVKQPARNARKICFRRNYPNTRESLLRSMRVYGEGFLSRESEW